MCVQLVAYAVCGGAFGRTVAYGPGQPAETGSGLPRPFARTPAVDHEHQGYPAGRAALCSADRGCRCLILLIIAILPGLKDGGDGKSASYPLSINTRIARDIMMCK